ncbi:MAG TPA: WhiB family transcriptional regulator [Acidimicrobiales bacterium]|nr:WhiB family transcriptional regulator [Acidimicrobiales bacterium]
MRDAIDIALGRTPFPGPWREQGACRQVPTVVFFPTRGEEADTAKAVCAACPVAGPCRDYALGVPDLKGVWGATTEEERRHVRRAAGEEEAPADEPESPGAVATAAAPGTLLAQLEILTGHAGRWARVGRFAGRDSAGALASMLRTGRRASPPGRWRFEGRVTDGAGSELWARYEGAALDDAG